MGHVSERWALVLPHREHLLRLARRRCADPHEAEDCVQEAMLQCASYPLLDPARVEQLLTTMTLRKCVDAHRARTRRQLLAARAPGAGCEPPPDERVCDRAEARWIAGMVGTLPDQQRDVLMARADGASPADIAAAMELSYKAVESALSRARRTLRAALAGASCALLALRRARGAALPAVTAYAVAVLTVVTTVVTGTPGDRRGAAPEVRVSGAPAVHSREAAPPAARSRPAGGVARPVVARPPDPPPPLPPPPPLVEREVGDDDLGAGAALQPDNDDYTAAERLRHCVEEGVVLTTQEIRCRYPDES